MTDTLVPVFDLGGVFVDWNPMYLFRKLFETEEEAQWFQDTICTKDWNLEFDAGDIYAEGVAKLSTAVEDMPAGDIVDQVGGAAVVFKLGADGVFKLGSAFDKLADSGLSSFSGIANVVSRISGAAVASKISAAEAACTVFFARSTSASRTGAARSTARPWPS